MLPAGRYCCFVVTFRPLLGATVKCPPLALSRMRQKTEGESNSGLEGCVQPEKDDGGV